MVAVAAWEAVRLPVLRTAMVTVRTSRLPLLRVSAPETDCTLPVMASKVLSSSTSALWPTAKLAASAAGNSSSSSRVVSSRMVATSCPALTTSPTRTLKEATVPAMSVRMYWASTASS